MENKESSSVLLGSDIVYEQIADWLSSARDYDAFIDSLKLSFLKSDNSRGLIQSFMEYKIPSKLEDRRKDVVADYIEDLVIATLDIKDRSNYKLIKEIEGASKDVAHAWRKNHFLFEDCAVASPEQIETYVDLIDRKFDLESYEYPHLVVGYKKMMQNQRHDKYNAGETDILDSNLFSFRTGEKINTPNWDMTNYVDILEQEGFTLENN